MNETLTYESLILAKKIITNNINLIKKTSNSESKAIDEFLDSVSEIPLIKLFTKEGLEDVTSLVSGPNTESQANVIEFFLRIKPQIDSIPGFNELCLEFNQELEIIKKLYGTDSQFTKLDINKDNIKKYYILNLILAYNTVVA